MRNIIVAIVSCVCILNAPIVFSNDLGVGVFLQRHKLYLDENPQLDLYISAFNNETTAQEVDVHIGIIDADGTVYEYPDWNTELRPWLPSFSVPAGLTFPLSLLENSPYNLVPGIYQFAAALTHPGTLDVISFDTTFFQVLMDEKDFSAEGNASLIFGRSAAGRFNPQVSSSGSFMQINTDNTGIDFNHVRSQIELGTADIDACVFHQVILSYENLVGENNIISLDAGPSLSLSAPSKGVVTLDKALDGANNMFYQQVDLDQDFYLAGETYTVTSAGGEDISPFRASVVAPERIQVIEPDLLNLNDIDSSQDFNLQWAGNNGIGELEIFLEGEAGTITCRFVDDGKANIPANLLVQLRDATAQGGGSILNIGGRNTPDVAIDTSLSFEIVRSRNVFVKSDAAVIDFSIMRILEAGYPLSIR